MTTTTEPKVLDQATVKELRWLQDIIGDANAAKGFHEEGDRLRTFITQPEIDNDPLTVADAANLRNYYTARLALIVTEAAEAIEELRNGRAVDETWYSAKSGVGQHTFEAAGEAERLLGVPGKPEGVPSELADIVIRAFDFADEAKIDLAAIIDEKLAYNATRGHKHGREF